MSDSERLNQIIADYLAAEKSGKAPNRDQLLTNHPELANELKAFFTDHDRMQKLAEQPADAETLPPKAQQFDPHGETLPPTELRDSTPQPGTKVRYFGDYELIEEIARGGRRSRLQSSPNQLEPHRRAENDPGWPACRRRGCAAVSCRS